MNRKKEKEKRREGKKAEHGDPSWAWRPISEFKANLSS
jgi:hypothetical protein